MPKQNKYCIAITQEAEGGNLISVTAQNEPTGKPSVTAAARELLGVTEVPAGGVGAPGSERREAKHLR